MKKLLVSVLAIAGLVACSQEQTLVSKSPASMEFGVASLDKATRVDPSLTTDNLQGFNVWAWMDSEDGNVLTAEDVERMGEGWGYVNTAYWLPGHYYSFAALAPMDSANWTYNLNGADNGEDNTIYFENVDGTEDLIYAFNTRSTVGDPVGKDYAALDLTFNHLLSKTKFTFVNGFATDNVTVQVTDVKMTAKNTATYSIEKKAWGEVTGEQITLAYGDTEVIAAGKNCVVADERLTIPAAAATTYEITYTIQVWYGKEPGFEGGLTKTTTLTGWEFVQGKAYNFVAEITPESLNLDEIEFTVVVNEWDEQDVNCGEIDEAFTFVTSAAEIQTILDAATDDVTILFGNEIKGDVTVLQKEGVNVTINGNGNKFDGVFTVNGNARSTGAETLTFTGIKFESDEAKTFISAPSKINNRYNYSHNVTIEDCTFTGALDQGVEVGSASFTGAYNIVMKNCVATNMHSLLQVQSIDNTVLVENVETIACKNGVSFGNTAYPTLRNAKIEAAEYGVRADGNASRGKLFIENSTIEAKQPVVVRKVTTAGYTVNVDAATKLKTAEAFQVIFTKGADDAAYVAPEVAFTFNGPAATAVFPGFAPADATVVKNVEELTAALNDANVENIVLNEGVYGVIVAKSNKTIIAAEGAKVDAVVFNGSENVTLKNIVFDAATAVVAVDGKGNGKQYANIATGVNGANANKGARNLVIDGCTFTGTFANGGASIAFTDQNRGSGQSGDITIKNCVFNTENAYYSIYTHYSGYGSFVIENNTFNTEFAQGGTIYLGRYQSSTPVVVKGNAFNKDASLDEAMYIQAHSSAYNVSIAAENNTFAN